jgi:hypothetical protein
LNPCAVGLRTHRAAGGFDAAAETLIVAGAETRRAQSKMTGTAADQPPFEVQQE